MRISESAGVFIGHIEKALDHAQQRSVYDKCADERKDQLVTGMVKPLHAHPAFLESFVVVGEGGIAVGK